MNRNALFLILLINIVVPAKSLLAQDANAPKFKPVVMPDAIRFASVFSQDKRVGATIFDNFILGTEAGIGTLPNAATKKFTYVLQPETDKKACVVQLIRGYVSTQGSGSAMMAVHSNGVSQLVDFDKAIALAKANTVSANVKMLHEEVKKKANTDGLKVARPARSDDFMVEVKAHVTPGQALQTSVVLLVDKLIGEENSSVVYIDSIDFEISPIVEK